MMPFQIQWSAAVNKAPEACRVSLDLQTPSSVRKDTGMSHQHRRSERPSIDLRKP